MLVCYDLLGLSAERVPRFVKLYETFYERGVAAMQSYAREVRDGAFPTAAHSFGVASVGAATSGVHQPAGVVEAKGGADPVS